MREGARELLSSLPPVSTEIWGTREGDCEVAPRAPLERDETWRRSACWASIAPAARLWIRDGRDERLEVRVHANEKEGKTGELQFDDDGLLIWLRPGEDYYTVYMYATRDEARTKIQQGTYEYGSNCRIHSHYKSSDVCPKRSVVRDVRDVRY